jgi:MraZ protein
MMQFSARYDALIDGKGRVVLPAAFKKSMGGMAEEPLVIEKDIYKNCLNIYPQKYWNQRLNEIKSRLNPYDENDDELLDELYENYCTISMAPNGRINIPSDFREHAQIVKDVVFVGKGESITLWDEKIYGEVKKQRKPLRNMFRERLGNNPLNEQK